MGMGKSVCIHTILYAVQLVLVVRGYMFDPHELLILLYSPVAELQ